VQPRRIQVDKEFGQVRVREVSAKVGAVLASPPRSYRPMSRPEVLVL